MYEAYFNLREKPFSLLPDPDFLFLSHKHRMALTVLEYGLSNQSPITVVTGEVGAGKTTLVGHMIKQLPGEVAVGLITNTHKSFGELLQWTLMAYGLEYRTAAGGKVELYDTLVNFLLDRYAQGGRTVLIIDEAQNMSPDALEELRMLSNVNSGKDQLLQLALIGQPELQATLRRAELKQFAQRVGVNYHLDALGCSESCDYIAHRMRVAGGDPAIFDDLACKTIWFRARGVPRVINVLCDTALVYAFAAHKRRVDASVVNEVVQDRRCGMCFSGLEPEVGTETVASIG